MSDDLRARIAEVLRHHGAPTHVDPGGLPADEFDCCADAVMAVVDEAVAQVLHEYADRLDAVDPQCTALTGPVWFGEGWHQAAHHLYDLADGHPGRMRREAGR